MGHIRLSSASARSQKLYTSEVTAEAKNDTSNGRPNSVNLHAGLRMSMRPSHLLLPQDHLGLVQLKTLLSLDMDFARI
jgi:hypothetical protein